MTENEKKITAQENQQTTENNQNENQNEEPKFSIKYLLKLILIFSLIVTIALCYVLATNTKIFLEKFNQEVPDFSVSNGSLDIKDKEEFEMYFDYFDVQLIMNENSKESDGKNKK